MTRDEILKMIQDFFNANYRSGNPKEGPHTHNGIDNLPINSANIVGGLVTEIIAGANISVSPIAGTGVVTITGTSSGGTPGGVDGDLQINASGNFGTIGGLNLDQTGNTRGSGSLDIQSSRSSVTQVASGTQSVTLGTGNTASSGNSVAIGESNSASGSAGSVAIGLVCTASGDQSSSFGFLNLSSATDASAFGDQNTASSSTTSAFGYKNVVSASGSNAFGNQNHIGSSSSSGSAVGFGNVISSSCANSVALGFENDVDCANSVAVGYSVTANGSGNFTSVFGCNITNTTPNSVEIGVDSGNVNKLNINGNGNYGLNGQSFGGAAGAIFIANATTNPASNPSGGGILYVNAGALTYRGSSGTVTVIAPA